MSIVFNIYTENNFKLYTVTQNSFGKFNFFDEDDPRSTQEELSKEFFCSLEIACILARLPENGQIIVVYGSIEDIPTFD